MPLASDVIYRFTSTSGPGNSSTSSPGASLGGFLATTNIDLATPLNNLFDDVTGAESAAGDTEYRCIAIFNNSTADTLTAPVAFLSTEVAGGASIAIGVDAIAASTASSTAAQAEEVANEDTAPSTSVSFSSPTSSGAGVSLGNISPQFVRGLWVRRTVSSGSTYLANDSATLRIFGKDMGPN